MGQRVQQARRRGRRVLVWAIAVFLVVQLTASALIDRYGLRIRFPAASEVLGRLHDRGWFPNVVAFGSSRFLCGLNEFVAETELRELTKDDAVTVYRLAVPAGDLTTSDYLLDYLLKMGARPQVAVIEISPEFLNTQNDWMSEHFRRQITWDNMPQYAWYTLTQNRIGSFLKNRFLPILVHRDQLRKEARRLWQDGWEKWSRDYALSAKLTTASPTRPAATDAVRCADFFNKHADLASGCHRVLTPQVAPKKDWDPAAINPQGLPLGEATLAGTETIHRWIKRYEIGGVAAAAVERILDRCHRHGIVPLLVVPAFTKSHQGLYTDDINQRFYAHLETVRHKYPFALADYRGCLPDDCLADNHHPNAEGGIQFTDVLVRDSLARLWRQFAGRIQLR